MKYAQLFEFTPIRTSLRLSLADRDEEAKGLVSGYHISEEMAKRLIYIVFPHLCVDHTADSRGLLIPGGHGAGKTHLLAALSCVAENLALAGALTHADVAEAAVQIAGRFKVIRAELGPSRASFRNCICTRLQEGLAQWGVTYRFPSSESLPDLQFCFAEMMAAFHQRFPGQGLLLVVDELPDTLCGPPRSANERDVAFLRDLGEVCGKLKFRFIAGLPAPLPEDPADSPNSLPQVQDSFQQVPIPGHDLSLLVAKQLLKKTPEQEQAICGYLRGFTRLYGHLDERMDEFVALFPIHPDYLKVVVWIPYTSPREILAAVSASVKNLLHQPVPVDHPGLISYDSFWEALSGNTEIRSMHDIEAVTEYNKLLKAKLDSLFTVPEIRQLAMRLVHALSVHRLASGDVYTQCGPRPPELRDSLCLHLPGMEEMGGESSDNLLLHVVGILDVLVHRCIGGQYLSYNPKTDQYFLHLKRFKRFVKPELVIHWINAVPFLLLMGTGGSVLASRFFHLENASLDLVLTIHKICAGCWVTLLPLTVLTKPKVHWQHVRPMLKWGVGDLVWMVQSVRSLVDRSALVPSASRFNTGQKMNACLVMMYFFGFTGTGALMIWKGTILFPWYVHTCFFLAAMGSVSGHLFLALINPSTRIALAGIFHGWAPMRYIEHHHSLSLPRSLRTHFAHTHVSIKTVVEELLAYKRTLILLVASIGVAILALVTFHRPQVGTIKTVFARSLSESIKPRELSPKHRRSDAGKACVQCHAYAGGVPDAKCEQCHEEIAKRRASLVGYHGKLKGDCIECHKEHPARSRSIVPLDKQKFDHSLAAFKREGKHAQVKCDDCHKNKRTADTPGIYYLGLKYDSCADCHRDKHAGQLGTTCGKCHSDRGWTGPALKFAHDRDSSFPLVGKHTAVACAKCHKPETRTASLGSARFKGLPKDCTGCHKEPHQQQFAAECTSCHSPAGWSREHLAFDHNRNSRFPLAEKHATVDCKKCHIPGSLGRGISGSNLLASAVFKGLPDKCSNCHNGPHRNQLAAECTACHSPAGWDREHLAFDHNRDSRFPLAEKHASVACAKCHIPNIPGEHLGFATFRGLKSECADCHKDPHQGQFERACTKCHKSPVPWSVARLQFDHARDTEYNLSGKHTSVTCVKCHKPQPPSELLASAKFKGLGRTCDTCHKVEHPAKYGSSCMSCHTFERWPKKNLGFEHVFDYRVAGENLTGTHLTAKCSSCHDGSRIVSLVPPRKADYDCYTCHQKDEPHKESLGKECSKCHTMDGWKGNDLRFEHNTMAKFTLDQWHQKLACAKCHENGHWKPLDAKCQNCHTDHFLEAKK